MHYRDMTFCAEETCANFGRGQDKCIRSLTQEIQDAADAWWGQGPGEAPICQFVGRPECYEEKT